MKKNLFLAVMAAVVIIVVSAGFASAQTQNVGIDIGIENDNTAIGTGGNAEQEQNQRQRQRQAQKQAQSNVIETPRPFVSVQYGTNFVSPGVGMESEGWKFYFSPLYASLSAKKVENMRRKFQFSDLWIGNWKQHVHITPVGERLAGTPTAIYMMDYWPKTAINVGDEAILSMNIDGDANMTDEAFIGMGASVCMEYGSSRFAILSRTNKTGVTDGMSVSTGGIASAVIGSGDKAAAITAGGQIGTIKTSVKTPREFEIICMNNGPLELVKDRNVTVTVTPPQAKACDPSSIWSRIDELNRRIKECVRWCLNNLQLRSKLGEAYIDLYQCTGDKRFLNSAIEQFQIAERNYLKGYDIKANQAAADQLIAQDYYYWAGCINILYGPDAADRFAKEKRVEKVPQF